MAKGCYLLENVKVYDFFYEYLIKTNSFFFDSCTEVEVPSLSFSDLVFRT